MRILYLGNKNNVFNIIKRIIINNEEANSFWWISLRIKKRVGFDVKIKI